MKVTNCTISYIDKYGKRRKRKKQNVVLPKECFCDWDTKDVFEYLLYFGLKYRPYTSAFFIQATTSSKIIN